MEPLVAISALSLLLGQTWLVAAHANMVWPYTWLDKVKMLTWKISHLI